ncbi:chemotaxis protein CheA [Gemmata sp. G18]|uniref:histidine kinase n=1 Tax=Gemmata palustris TaxID=2822762 RepID=A0ABS5BSL5_9BACT|nr:chemotaxis protein CheA [Gemmata palustris]MBP3956724.1 chemotaxis protein CheA [Gemmata palustris]
MTPAESSPGLPEAAARLEPLTPRDRTPVGPLGPVADRLESLARDLLRLEDRADPATAVSAADNCACLARATAYGPPLVARLAAALAAATADIRDGRIVCSNGLPEALIAASDALASALGLAGEEPVDAGAEVARTALSIAVERASAAPPQPGPSNPPTDWPAPGQGLAPDLLAQFTTESADSLQEAEGALLELEGQSDHADAINRLFRAVHSIKGTAGYVGLNQIRVLSHKLENVLSLVRSGRLPLAGGASEFAFQGVDHLKGMVGALTPTGERPTDLSEFIAVLDVLCGQATESVGSSGGAGPSPETVFRDAASQYLEGLTDGLNSIAKGDCTNAVLALLRRSATSLKTSAACVGRADIGAPADELLTVLARLTSARDRLAAAIGGRDSFSAPAAPPAPAPAAPTPPVLDAPPAPETVPSRAVKPATSDAGPGARPAPGGKTMRVDQRKLDEYVNLAGELVIARNSLVHAHRLFQTDRSTTRGLKDAVDKVCRIIGDVQSNAMGMRMVPVGTVFQRFPRLVRDVAKTLGKQIELELHGEDTELDKQVAEALSDPLVHLVRNAADHGIESPQARREADKREVGVIALRAGREGNVIVIDIQDDGGGIDAERLKAKAVSTGVITAEQAAVMTREESLQLIFAAGLSTAQVVSDLSGRGVGMDVVKNNIAALGGSVTIRSEPGQGTCIRLALPLTLAVTTVVLVEAGGMTFGLPIDVVQETLKVAPDSFHQLRGVRAVALRGDIIPVKPLGQLIGLPPPSVETRAECEQTNRVPVVVLTVAGTRFGVVVDALKGQQEIVLKPVPRQLGQIDGIGGATITGDGGIVLILDPAGLYRRAVSDSTSVLDSLTKSQGPPIAAC